MRTTGATENCRSTRIDVDATAQAAAFGSNPKQPCRRITPGQIVTPQGVTQMPLPPRWQRTRLGAIPTGDVMGEHPDMTATTTGHPPHPVRAQPARTSPTPWPCPQPPDPPRRPLGRQGDAQRPPHSASPSTSSHLAIFAVTHAVHGPSHAERVPYMQPKLPCVKCRPQGRTAVVGTQ